MAFKIYTKTGDQGLTGLIGGTRIPKSHLRIEAYGTIDELNSWLGLVSDHCGMEEISLAMKAIQDRLFSIGSSLACDPEKETRMLIPDLHDSDTRWLEEAIDRMNETLPELKQFILPGGDVSSSHIHIARCVCRRAERICVQLKMEQQYVNEKILIYLNRLSDYLFVLSRYVLYLKKGTETVWNPRG